MAERQRFLEGKLAPSSYQWILEIAEHSSTCFPSLGFVTLVEKTTQGSYRMFVKGEWIQPLAVEQAFDQAGIDLEVSVRAPRR
jgi:hypothetical protein